MLELNIQAVHLYYLSPLLQVTLDALRKDIMEKVVKEVIPAKYLDEDTKYHINPCGNFVIGGPMVSISEYR